MREYVSFPCLLYYMNLTARLEFELVFFETEGQYFSRLAKELFDPTVFPFFLHLSIYLSVLT